jgi:Leucine-rich repeat (LRR) protein
MNVHSLNNIPSKWNYRYISNNYGHVIGLYIQQNFYNFYPVYFESICSLYHLEELRLPNNNISFIPHSIKNLKSLKFLDLYMNDIQTLPEDFKNLNQLKYLNLGENKFYDIPKILHSMKNLTYIDLSANKIQFIPESITNLIWIEKLDLAYNEIKDISDQVLSLDSLKLNDLIIKLNLGEKSNKKNNSPHFYFKGKNYVQSYPTPYEQIRYSKKVKNLNTNEFKTYKIHNRMRK